MSREVHAIQKELAAAGDSAKAALLRRFFKTGPGEYGEGDRFRGVTVPAVRAIARRHPDLPEAELDLLLASPWHEDRLCALLILTLRAEAKRTPAAEKDAIFAFYLARTPRINNWDLVDLSAPAVVGRRLVERNDPSPLFELARSSLIWERRIGMVGSHAFIRERQTSVAFILADMLLGDRHDLMHKAAGWMLREAGKRDLDGLRHFLRARAGAMPRTMLRYAIERFPEPERLKWLRAG